MENNKDTKKATNQDPGPIIFKHWPNDIALGESAQDTVMKLYVDMPLEDLLLNEQVALKELEEIKSDGHFNLITLHLRCIHKVMLSEHRYSWIERGVMK